MMRLRVVGRVAAIMAMAGGLIFCTNPAFAQINSGAPAAAGASQSISNLSPDHQPVPISSILKVPDGSSSAATAADSAATSPSTAQRLEADVKETAARIAHLTKIQRRKWELAQAALPGFCQDWSRMRHDRELNNVSHLTWSEHEGYETASYTGYGKVQGCEAKESEEGIPIGKVRYQEMNYYLAGKTIDDAKAHPKVVGTTNTLEIFSWEKDRWFY